jgi:hypothetical protein
MSPALFCLTDSLSMLCYASRPFKVVHLAFDMFIQMMYKLHSRFSCVFLVSGMIKPHLDGSVAHRAFSITI